MELELLPFCRTHEVGFIPYFPLAGGSLTEKYKAGEPPPEGTRGAGGSPLITRLRSPRAQVIAEELKEFAHERGHTLGELAIAWLLARPEVSVVITGTSNPEQVEANAKAAGWSLTPQGEGSGWTRLRRGTAVASASSSSDGCAAWSSSRSLVQ